LILLYLQISFSSSLFFFLLNTPISCHSRFSHSRAWSSPLGLTRRWEWFHWYIRRTTYR
jgi:hypothetical protein